MRSGIEIRIIVLALIVTAVLVAPSTVVAVVFVVVMWALWRHHTHRRGVRR